MSDKSTNYETRQEELRVDILARMRRIEGQIRGVAKMVEAGKECQDILIQVSAARSAMRAVNELILKRFMLKCYADTSANGNQDSHNDGETPPELEKFIAVLSKFLDG